MRKEKIDTTRCRDASGTGIRVRRREMLIIAAAAVIVLSAVFTVQFASEDSDAVYYGTSIDGPGTHVLFNSERTGSANSSYDQYFSYFSASDYRDGPITKSFTMNYAPTEKVILTISAYDVDEESGERDIIYLRDMTAGTARVPVYRPGSTTLNYLSGADETWSTSSFEIDPSKFVSGHTYRFELNDSVGGWHVWIRQVTMEVQQQSIQFNSLSASIDASGNVTVKSSVTASKGLASTFTYEYVADCGGITYGTKSISISNTGTISSSHSFKLSSGFPSGVYQITLHIKDYSSGKVLASSATTASPSLYTVSYNSNGGSSNIPVDTNGYRSGQTAEVKFDYIPSKPDMTFVGWDSDPTASAPRYTATGTRTIVMTGNVDLYAIYEAAPVATGKMIIKSEDTYRGDGTLTFTVSFEGVKSMKSILLQFTYETTGTVESYSWIEEGELNYFDGKDGVAAWPDYLDPNTDMFSITFRIAKGSESFTLSCTAILNPGMYTYTAERTVIEKNYVDGDLDGDEMVTSDDAIYLLYSTFLPEKYPLNQDADFNDDGIVDSDDAIYLLYYTFLPDRYPLHPKSA